MTLTGRPITQKSLRMAQGPHTLGSDSDGGYFVRWADLPHSMEIEYSSEEKLLKIQFAYGELAATEASQLTTDVQLSGAIDQLRLETAFSKSGNRLLEARFIGCDLGRADAAHLASGVAKSIRRKMERSDLSPQQQLAMKAIAIVLENELAEIIKVMARKAGNR
ncbi:MAG: hypothetical protein MUC36_02430 [Planctomycetes bacterium]|jgi:hypothetical protein|nr:hypothetical protein [Planctomycetota bacterium]